MRSGNVCVARQRLGHIASALASASLQEHVRCTCGCGEVAKACGCPAAVEALSAATRSVDDPAVAVPENPTEVFNQLDNIVVSDPDVPLSDAQLNKFLVDGYIALPGIIPNEFNGELMNSVDELMDARTRHTIGSGDWSHGLIAEFGELGTLCSWPPIVDKVKQLMQVYGNGRVDCGMHHIHATRQDAGTGPSPWHQDYMLRPPVIDRAQLHIHVFFYFNGLDGTVGDLMVLPGSQYSYWDSLTLRQTFKDTPLPGSKVFDSLPNGSAVIAHSGLVHGRRQKPGGEAHPRYFVDISYCQPGEFITNNRMERKRAELSLAIEKNLHHDGKYMHLWDVEGVVMAEKQVVPDENVEESEARQAAYRQQVKRQTGGARQIR